MKFDWDEHNLAHIARHGVTQNEFEEAFCGATIFVKDEDRHGETRSSYVGRTAAGRILLLIATVRHDRIRCVTAFPANRAFRKAYIAEIGGTSL